MNSPTRQAQRRTRRRLAAALSIAASAAVLPVPQASAQADGAWPTKPVRLIVTFAPGGGAVVTISVPAG